MFIQSQNQEFEITINISKLRVRYLDFSPSPNSITLINQHRRRDNMVVGMVDGPAAATVGRFPAAAGIGNWRRL